mgnify:CR=1 FL=1
MHTYACTHTFTGHMSYGNHNAMYTYPYIHTSIHTIHTLVRTCIQICIRTCTNTCIYTYIGKYVHAFCTYYMSSRSRNATGPRYVYMYEIPDEALKATKKPGYSWSKKRWRTKCNKTYLHSQCLH